MFTFDVIINPIILIAAIFGGVIIGFIFGRGQFSRRQRKVEELEREMMNSHAEILEIQKAYVQLEQKMKEHAIPVIAMKLNGKENPKEKATK